MPELRIDDSLTMHYEDHYFGEAWLKPETVLMVHGVAESGAAWDQWVPHFARNYRVVRPDLRGFGESTVPPAGYPFKPDGFAAELAAFVRALDIGPVHIIGAKIGGSVSMQFAADYPELTRSLAVFSGPVRARNTGGSADLTTFEEWVRTKGVRAWLPRQCAPAWATRLPRSLLPTGPTSWPAATRPCASRSSGWSPN